MLNFYGNKFTSQVNDFISKIKIEAKVWIGIIKDLLKIFLQRKIIMAMDIFFKKL